jgi:hypothetical protein
LAGIIAAQLGAAELRVCVSQARVRIGAEGCSSEGRQTIPAPKVDRGVMVASATRSPWIVANGWRYLREPGSKFRIENAGGAATLAIAEALAYSSDLFLTADETQRQRIQNVAALVEKLTPVAPTDVADFDFVDDGNPLADEALNMLARRNLLFHIARKSSGGSVRREVRIGSTQFPEESAHNPSDFAYRVRKAIGDENRSLRIFGSEFAIARLHGDRNSQRLHLLNYQNSPLRGIRVRVRGPWKEAKAYVFERPSVAVEGFTKDGSFVEFTIPELGAYAVVDLR